jgi:hypothetical protein
MKIFLLTIATDWITAIAALAGVPVAVWGIFKLFIKDQETAQKLKFIEDEVNELKKQTSQFELQTELMRESNGILKQQFELQAEIHIGTKTKEESKEIIDKQKRKNEIKPRFIFNGGQASGLTFIVTLLNKGKRAEKIQIKSINSDFVDMTPIKEGFGVDEGQILSISGSVNPTKSYYTAAQVACEILISFENEDGDKYLQKVVKGYSGYQIENPYEDLTK